MGCRFVSENDSMYHWLHKWELECECEDGSIEICSSIEHMHSNGPDRPDKIWVEAINKSIEQLKKKRKELIRVIRITYSSVRGGYE